MEGKEIPCAGWLAAVGYEHIGVRVLMAFGDIPPEALEPRPGLFLSYEEMEAAMARRLAP